VEGLQGEREKPFRLGDAAIPGPVAPPGGLSLARAPASVEAMGILDEASAGLAYLARAKHVRPLLSESA
jgi:hypothetical protein